MTIPIHVVALGARTAVGATAAASAAAVRARVSRIAEHPFMVDIRGEPIRLTRDALLPADLFGAPRLLELARTALAQIVQILPPKLGTDQPIRLLLGLPDLNFAWATTEVEKVAAAVSRLPGPAGCEWSVQPFTGGHAVALDALRCAKDALQTEQPALCVVGGLHTYLDPYILLWLDGHRRLDATGARSGTVPGEGAGFLALANEAARRTFGLASLGTLRAVATGQEQKLNGTSAVNLGEGLTDAIRGATASLSTGKELIDDIYCDINGERYRTEEWGFALLRSQKWLRTASSYVSAVSQWGDVGAATGALLPILALRAWKRGYARGPLSLVWSSSDSGLRAAAILQAPQQGY